MALLISVPAPASAQQADVPGSRDHPALNRRFPGSTIVVHDQSKFDEYVLATGPIQREDAYGDTTRLEGNITRIVYRIDKERSPLEVAQTYESALNELGYQTIWACDDRACGGRGFNLTIAPYAPIFGDNWQDQRYLTARKGGTWIALYVARRYNIGGPDKDYIYAQLHVVETGEMEGRLVAVDAAAMEEAIAARGGVALYGIAFASGSAEILPESRPQLDEIAELLQADPDLELLVVGHTDNTGTLEYNFDLSKRRADAVRSDLIERYGIAPSRLDAHGVGYLAPVTTNQTEDGRARNRRVELVRR